MPPIRTGDAMRRASSDGRQPGPSAPPPPERHPPAPAGRAEPSATHPGTAPGRPKRPAPRGLDTAAAEALDAVLAAVPRLRPIGSPATVRRHRGRMFAAMRNLLAAGYPAADLPDLLDRQCPAGSNRSAVSLFESAAISLVQQAASGTARETPDRNRRGSPAAADRRIGARPAAATTAPEVPVAPVDTDSGPARSSTGAHPAGAGISPQTDPLAATPAIDPLAATSTVDPPAAKPAVDPLAAKPAVDPLAAKPAVDSLAATLFDDLVTAAGAPSADRAPAPRTARWHRLHGVMQRRGARDVALSLLVILAAVSVVLATRSGAPTAPAAQETGNAVTAAPGPVRIVAQERGAGTDSTLTVSVPGAPRAAAIPATAFEVSVDGRRTAAKVDPVAIAGLNLAVLVDSSSEATKSDLQAAGNGLTELMAQLPAGSRVSLVISAGPSVLTPATSEVARVLAPVTAATPKGTSAPGSGLRLAAQQVSAAPRLHRAVLLVGASMLAHHEREILDAALDAQTAGTPIYVVNAGAAGSDALRAALSTTGGASFDGAPDAPLRGYDTVAADLSNQYRLTFPTPVGASTAAVAVNAAGVTGSTTTALDAGPR